MRVIFRNCGFVRFPVFGTISGPHLECVQRFLFVLCHSNFLVQALSNGRFWLQESDFGLNKWCQACFWRKLPPKPASSIQLKSFMFGRLVTGILHKKGWPEKPFTFQSSLREVRGNWYILLGVRDPARKVHELERFMLECDSKHLKRKKCSHQTPNPKFTWKSAFLTAFVQKWFSFWIICFAMFFRFLHGGGPFKHHT